MHGLEYLDLAYDLAGQVGRIIKEEKKVLVNDDPRFCVELDIEQGWFASLIAPNVNGKMAKILMAYEDKMYHCRHCLEIRYSSGTCSIQRMGYSSSSIDTWRNERNF